MRNAVGQVFFERSIIFGCLVLWSGYFVELLSRLVCQLAMSFYTFLALTFMSQDHEEIL